jgi:OmcA/MtrC family decaheme c-type cytochrome
MSLLFVGCSGNDGATGAAGPSGTPGPPGTGVLANETCVVCHGAGKIMDVAAAHGVGAATGTVTATINSVTFNPDNAVVTFTFAATDSAGNPVRNDILLTTSGSNLAYARFTIARLVPGQVYVTGNKDPDSWFFYGPRSHRYPNQLTFDGTQYTFTFVDNTALDPAWNNYTHRVGIEIYGLPSGLRSVNPTFDFVPNQGAGPYTFATTRNVVTIDACNGCHNPLGTAKLGGSAFHGGRRVETKFCVMCHNPNNDLEAPSGPINFVKLVHGIHTSQDLGIIEDGVNVGDFTEVTFPQDVRNCTKCHTGGSDSDNWKTRPSAEACGSCHADVDFATGANHVGGVQLDNRFCATCHPTSDAFPSTPDITQVHRTTNATPNNPEVPAGLANFAYFIDDVTVSNNVAVVTFHITKDGAPLSLSHYPPTGFTSGPSFLLAWALPQDGVGAPTEYNNRNSPQAPDPSNGNGAGDAPSVSLASVAGSLTVIDNTQKIYQASLTSAPYPTSATMRAVAIQGSFTQTGVDLDGDPLTPVVSVGRPTPSVMKAVTGDAVRRQVVDWENGCLACHETLQLHGGSRVNNTQVCVFCHNPNKSSSGRTVDPAIINPAVVAAVGSDPLLYPEAAMNFKELVHGIHRGSTRPYEFVRNRVSGGLAGFYYNWSEVTFPGNLMACTKCHIGSSYMPNVLPAGVLMSTERTTTGNSAETRADIIAARGSVPNSTDLVNSPVASACYYCHDEAITRDHMVLNGGKIRSTRSDAILALTPSP